MFGKSPKAGNRFVEKHREQCKTLSAQLVVLVDRETGVNYLASAHGLYPDCLTPLLGADGKPIVDDVSALSE
ncbi:hypothetical protein EI53_01265 [Fusobacterium naviforme]|nr:hypothetical protein F7P78_06320 [Fusobacterium naviforme]PSL10203.1 hypothetical protein EI53_01265 [Fusobacterium naviforme]STO27613.1 Uncharacterised protein [Fusobacterium naviforme]